MQYIQGNNRSQAVLFPKCLDELVDQDNEVRIIDLFVETIKLEDFKFIIKHNTEGRPSYDQKDLLKLFIYGYLNSMRSSRVLEKECHRNIEVMWLLKDLAPDHNTISNFRRDNEKAIRKVFQYTVSIAKMFDLIGGKLIAGDSTKLRAQNSKKNNYNAKKIERHLAYIDAKLDEYNDALKTADEDNQLMIETQMHKHENRKEFYNTLSDQLEQTGEVQVSTSDPESRQLITRNNITEVGYNVQTVVDATHCIPIDYKVTNENDSKAMGGMLRRTKVILGQSDFTALFDKGYHTGSEIKTACVLGVNQLVAIPGVASFAPDPRYNYDQFIYDENKDKYTCPRGRKLTTNGNWYKRNTGRSTYKVKHYKTTKCQTCPARHLCTISANGRVIERSEYAPYIEQNKRNIENDPELYRRRQSIVEHPYGIIKRQWGFSYIMTKKTMKRASADVGLMFTAFNLRRLINIIGKNEFKKYLEGLVFSFFTVIELCRSISSNMSHPFFQLIFLRTEIKVA
jgi:transposase